MKIAKKLLLILLALTLSVSLVFTLASCGDNTPEDNDGKTEEPETPNEPEDKDEPVKKETFTVTFDSNGGSEVASQTVEGGKYLEKPANPTRKGYTFLGWYVEDEKWSFIGYVVAKNITLTAKWEPIGTAGLKYSEIDNGLSVIGYVGRATEVVIPEIVDEKPVIEIAEEAFYGNTSITSVTIPDSVTSIGNVAFCYCYNLTSVTIGNGVTSIGSSAFYACTSLKSVTIPDSVTSIGDDAFRNCTSLEYNKYDNALYLGNSTNPYLCLVKADNTSITSCNIHNNTKFIHRSAFESCRSLTSVTIGNSVTSIGDFAFSWCLSLTNITIPDSVTSIGDGAFNYCSSLTSVTIPDSVTSIGERAFYWCTSLTSVTIPDRVISIGDEAFSDCTSLTSITVSAGNPNYKDIDGNLYTKDGKTLVQYAIGKTATSFAILDSVTSIGDYAFSGCTSLASVTIGHGVTSIAEGAFAFCTSLTSITIPDGVTEIGDYAFYYCTSLTTITIPDSVTSIGDFAFNYCTSLTTINYLGTEEQWKKIKKGYVWDFNSGDYTVVYNYTEE